MKRLSDYKGNEAIELWADLLEPITRIFQDKNVETAMKSGKAVFQIAGEILKTHSKDASEMLLRIDPTPLDGLNIVLRLAELVKEIGEREELRAFFGYTPQAMMDKESTGSPTESTEAEEN